MKKANKTSVATKASKAEVVDTISSVSTVDTVDTTSSIPAEAPKAEAINTSISANPNTTTEAAKAKKVLDIESFNVSKAIVLGYRTAEQANAEAENHGHPRYEDEKDLAEVKLAIFEAHATIRVPVVDRRGGLYRGCLIWVSYMLNTDGSVAKNTVRLYRNGKPAEADLMVSPVDPDKASK